jgi:hypothetical protein
VKFMCRLAFAPHMLPPADPAYQGEPLSNPSERQAA